MSQKKLRNHELISGSGDACNATNPVCLPNSTQVILEKKSRGKSMKASSAKLKQTNDVLNKKFTNKCVENVTKGCEQIQELKKRSVRRALTLNDMTPPHGKKRLQERIDNTNKTTNIDKNEFLTKQLVMSKLLSSLYFKLWKKKKILSDELKEQIKQLLVQKSFLNQMREKESSKRDELSILTEHLHKNIDEYETQISHLKEERDSLKITLHNLSNNFTVLRLELEKSEYLKMKFEKISNEHLECIHRINEELAKLKMENTDQKRKILYMNNVADQQDVNLKQLLKIADDLDVNLKEKIETARTAFRRRDEAIEKEEQATYRLNMLETCLKESKEMEKNLRLEITQVNYLVDEAEKRKLLIVLENVDLKYKLESTENLLRNALAQIKQFECKTEMHKRQTIFSDIRMVVPWRALYHLSIYFFPLIASSLSHLP